MRPAIYRLLLVVVLLLARGELAAQNRPWIRQDVPFGTALQLKAFGGSDVDLRVLSREMSTISVQWSDHTQKVPKTSTDINGFTEVIYVSPTFTRTIKKENGISPDGRLSEAYLIYDDQPSGVKVYFYDTIGTPQNHHALFIEQPQPGRQMANGQEERADDVDPNPEPPFAGPMRPDFSDPARHPTWSLIGDTLLFEGYLVTEEVTREAAAFGLDRDLFVDERMWIQKQRIYGKDQTAEYDAITAKRLARKSAPERAAIERMRAMLLAPAR